MRESNNAILTLGTIIMEDILFIDLLLILMLKGNIILILVTFDIFSPKATDSIGYFSPKATDFIFIEVIVLFYPDKLV